MSFFVASTASFLRRVLDVFLRPTVFLPVAVAAYLATNVLGLTAALHEEKGRADLVSGDTGHYLDIGRTFATGDFSMAYVQDKPHRQPLYPLLLSPVFRWGNGSFFALGAVNIVVGALTLVLIYEGIRRRLGQPLVAAGMVVLFVVNDFMLSQTTRHLLTEPLHVLLMTGIILALLRYLETRQIGALLGAAALTGLDYLARPNGLFVMAALLVTLLAGESWPRLRGRELVKKASLYGAALIVFMIVSAPSWIPREKYFGSPFYHGYLSNYLWVDTYKEGHVGQREAIYGWRDYVRTHSVGDAIKRGAWGIWEVTVAIPCRVEGRVPLLFVLALGGVLMTALRGPKSLRLLLLFATIQLLPLMWTHLSNPTVRVPYASTIPFEIIFAASFLACLVACKCWPQGGRSIGNAV